MPPRILVVLDNVRSVHNVGSIFRTCDAAGAEKLILCGVTPTPTDRFGRTRKDVAKVALGAEKSVPWEHVMDTAQAVERLHKEGVTVVGVEQTKDAANHKTFSVKEPTAFVFGNEVEGIAHDTLARCDAVIDIPMRGTKESLNVSVAVGVILFSTR